MKKAVKVLCLVAILACGAVFTSGCGTPFPLGALYTQINMPVALGDGDMQFNRTGTSRCYSILGWFAAGDSSLNAAASAGQINHVSWASQRCYNVLGIYGVWITSVYGFGDSVGADPNVADSDSL